MDQILVTRIVEGALLAASQPLTVAQLAALFTLDEPAPEGSIAAALAELQAQCEGRGVELVEVASGWRYQVQADVHAWVSRMWAERQIKYTRATLETLALIAYRQPITRGEIEQIRGVATNSNIIKTLEERDWIRVVGHREVPGRPELLGTTKGFLDYFGLKRLDELPPLSELKDFGELDPQFDFDVAPIAANSDAGTDETPGLDEGDADDASALDTASDTDAASAYEGVEDASSGNDTEAEMQDAETGDDTGAASTQDPGDAEQAASSSTSTHDNEEHDIAADGEVRSTP
ncbi:SMC-Scp complex subunit ScpB [Lysobacter oculi]|uniref:SMC-Scp complex subunit ScpB n=1 Tax=Solilutibacter oculi TaxID=2698682 RepID=A0A344J4F1_9GAMM|nr:SMC-Scp complex subunit ScpB [Lysobacter oculi]AXA83911.1 SMC-Scp complex subunit ScpB [Lysobacter oculi]